MENKQFEPKQLKPHYSSDDSADTYWK